MQATPRGTPVLNFHQPRNYIAKGHTPRLKPSQAQLTRLPSYFFGMLLLRLEIPSSFAWVEKALSCQYRYEKRHSFPRIRKYAGGNRGRYTFAEKIK